MKIVIAKGSGWLFIERAGKMKAQECPFAEDRDVIDGIRIRRNCGDWCPLFGEPKHIESVGELTGRKVDCGWELEICQGRALTGEIVDERRTP